MIREVEYLSVLDRNINEHRLKSVSGLHYMKDKQGNYLFDVEDRLIIEQFLLVNNLDLEIGDKIVVTSDYQTYYCEVYDIEEDMIKVLCGEKKYLLKLVNGRYKLLVAHVPGGNEYISVEVSKITE